MSPPYFYIPTNYLGQDQFQLEEDTSKYIIQVLRMKPGEALQLTDGKGNLLTAAILDDHKKRCIVTVNERKFLPRNKTKTAIGISLLKNASRLEWFLEKATEMGITEIIPIICERTEKQKFRLDRMKNILISAMLQSQQAWLPELHEPVDFKKVVEQSRYDQKFIAHCLPGQKINLTEALNKNLSSQFALIGPEGDFTSEEIQLAIKHQYVAVALGETRLRSETAALVAATILAFKIHHGGFEKSLTP